MSPITGLIRVVGTFYSRTAAALLRCRRRLDGWCDTSAYCLELQLAKPTPGRHGTCLASATLSDTFNTTFGFGQFCDEPFITQFKNTIIRSQHGDVLSRFLYEQLGIPELLHTQS